ncbi:hypothetical protein CL622_07140 [archaeon]|nr:hypothetical protein [archaeon]
MARHNKSDEGKQTQFNMGIADLERINAVLEGLDRVTVLRDTEENQKMVIVRWKENFALLKALFKELSSAMSKEDLIKHHSALQFCKGEFNYILNNVNHRKVTVGFLEYFDDWEMELRRFAKDAGFIMPDKADMTEALGV